MSLRIYTIIGLATLESVIPDDICQIMGYDSGAILKDKVLSYVALDSGLYAISVNLKASNKKCAWTGLNNQELELAKQMYGEDNLLTVEQYKELDFKQL